MPAVPNAPRVIAPDSVPSFAPFRRCSYHGGSRIGANATLLAVVMAGASLMYLAPGNAVRGAMFADTHQFFRSLTMSALQAVRFIGLWVLSPALLALSVLPGCGKKNNDQPVVGSIAPIGVSNTTIFMK